LRSSSRSWWASRRACRCAAADGRRRPPPLLAFTASFAWLLHPVCVAIPPEDLANFSPPIETRTDTDMIGERVFRQRDGGWFQCKPWIARAMFF